MEYIAFDIGDGTTCAARYNNSFAETNRPPQKLHIVRGVDEIWSAIGYDKNGGNPYVGEAANRPGYTIYSNWKSKPTQYVSSGPDAWKRKTAVDFMRLVFDNFLSNNPDYNREGMFNGNPYTIVIGVPCDWSDASSVGSGESNDIDEYRKMANEAGMPNVQVMKESQAAMFYARRFMRGGIPDKDILSGVLLIDVGSSTTDFTYMRGADQVGHCGIALGAQAVERSFLAEAMKRENVRYWMPEPAPGVRVLTKNQADVERMVVRDAMRVRQYKEKYFCGVDQSKDHIQETLPLPMSKMSVGEVDGGEGYITSAYVDYCLNSNKSPCKFKLAQLSEEWDGVGLDVSNTWRGHFVNALKHVKEKWGLDSETSIVVTGGATRMQFVEEDICTVFNPSKKPYFGDDGARSFSVVMGLAWGAYAKGCLDQALCRIRESFPSKEITEEVVKFVVNYLEEPAQSIAKAVKDTIVPLLRAHDSSVGTLRKLNDKYSQIFIRELNQFIEKANNGINISVLLQKQVIKGVNTKYREEFSRPNITIDTNVVTAIPWTYSGVSMSFDPFSGHDFIRAADLDESFEGILGMGLKYDNAADGFYNSFSANTVMDVFTDEEAKNQNGEKMPSDCHVLCYGILEKVLEFLCAEIVAMQGTMEYGLRTC